MLCLSNRAKSDYKIDKCSFQQKFEKRMQYGTQKIILYTNQHYKKCKLSYDESIVEVFRFSIFRIWSNWTTAQRSAWISLDHRRDAFLQKMILPLFINVENLHRHRHLSFSYFFFKKIFIIKKEPGTSCVKDLDVTEEIPRQVTGGDLKLTPIHASVTYQITWICRI